MYVSVPRTPRYPAAVTLLAALKSYLSTEGVVNVSEVVAGRAKPLGCSARIVATPGVSDFTCTENAPPELLEEAVAIMLDTRPAAMRTMARAFAEADLRDVLSEIRVPTLLLYGDTDRRAPLPVAEALHAQIPAARLVVMAGVGHESNIEAAERFTNEVRGFLRTLER